MAAPAAPVIKTQPFAKNQSLSFTWTADPGNVDVYYIYDNDGISTLLTSVPGTTNLTTVTGLTNGQTYNAFISGSNVNGMGAPSFFRPFQPGLPPTVAPLTATATVSGDRNVLIEWTPSGESLTAPIQWYAIKAVSSDPAASNFRYTADGLKPETTYFATGLNYYTYQFTVQGVNCPGYSPAALTNSVTFTEPIGGSWNVPQVGSNQALYTTTTFGWLPGAGSFTWECFAYFTTTGSNDSIQWEFGQTGFNRAGIILQQQSGGKSVKRFCVEDITDTDNQLTYNDLLTTNVWYHFAISRDGSTKSTALWINGSRESVKTINASLSQNDFDQYFATIADQGGGYLTNVNFIQGTYTYDPANVTITVPTSPLTSNVNTEALWLATDASNIFTDSGPNAYTTSNDSGITWASNSPF